jgi:hypothetical protein
MKIDINLRPLTLRTLRHLQDQCKRGALAAGHFGPPYTPGHYDGRDKQRAFRSSGYIEQVRFVNALEEVIEALTRQ